jgi:putative sterol carrier protein
MGNVQSEIDQRIARLWGTYVVPSLEGVNGVIEYMGPLMHCYMAIEGNQVKLAQGAPPRADAVIASTVPEELISIVQGKSNLVTSLLKGNIEVKGDLMLLTEIAGCMPELARQTDARGAVVGGA